jgi:hypothetical protein
VWVGSKRRDCKNELRINRCFGSLRHAKKVCALSAVSAVSPLGRRMLWEPSCQDCQLSRGRTQRTPGFLRDIRSLCDPPEAMQCRAEVIKISLTANSLQVTIAMTCSRRHKDPELGLSCKLVAAARNERSVQGRTGPLRRYGPGIGIVTATVARFSGSVQKRGGFFLHFRPALYLRTVTRHGGYFAPELCLDCRTLSPNLTWRLLRPVPQLPLNTLSLNSR